MMGRQTDEQGHQFYDFRLDEAVPADRGSRSYMATTKRVIPWII